MPEIVQYESQTDSVDLEKDWPEIVQGAQNKIDTASNTIQALLAETDSIADPLKDSIQQALASNNPDSIADAMEQITETMDIHDEWSEHHGNQTLIMILSLLATAWFAYMIVWAARSQPISFLKHHAVFAGLTIAMATQMPHEIMHGLIESGIAFVAIMGITRVSRWIINKVDFSQLEWEDAKTALWFLWPLASIITTPAAASVFAKMREKMTTDEKYIAMQTIGNVDGWIGIGDFPFLYNWMKNWIIPGTIRQAWVMLPTMVFHKLYQALLWKIWPKKIKNAWPVIRNIFKWFRFDFKRLGHSASIEGEERVELQELLHELQKQIEETTDIDTDEKAIIQDVIAGMITEGTDGEESIDNPNKNTDIMGQYASALEDILQDPKSWETIWSILNMVQRAITSDGISQSELNELRSAIANNDTATMQEKIPGLKWLFKKLEDTIEWWFSTIMGKIHASHNEVEIWKVFTAQALAISLLVPAFSALLKRAPAMLEPLDAWFSSVADNYAATAVTWMADNAKSLSFAILGWALSLFGNMANLNFLGKDGSFLTSLKMAKYMIPTLMFAYWYFNSDLLDTITKQKDTSHMTQTIAWEENNPDEMSNMSRKQRDSLKAQWKMTEYTTDRTQE